MKTVLITGATGYIGSQLAGALLQDGVSVVAMVREKSSVPSILNQGLFSTRIYDGTRESVGRVFLERDIDAVFHLAAQAGTEYVPEDIDSLIDTNIKLGVHLLDGMISSSCRVFISTGTYWQRAESSVYRPMNLYAATKQGFQDILSWYCFDKGVRGISLNLYDVYGPNDPRKKLFWLLRESARKGIPLDMTAGEQVIFPVHILDVISAYKIAWGRAEAGGAGLEVFDVAGQAVCLKDIVQQWIDCSGKDLRVNWGVLPYRPSQIMNPFCGETLPGWVQEKLLVQGLKELVQHDVRD